MRIFKFGGASVKNADGVKNLASVLTTVGYENTLVVVSAMGKTTNALEVVIEFVAITGPQLSFESMHLFGYGIEQACTPLQGATAI